MATRILVTGSRTWDDYDYLSEVFKNWDNTIDGTKVLVSGNCPSGADYLAEKICEELGWKIERYPADWDKHGKRAGFVRNSEMVETNPDFVIAFNHNGSRGTAMTVRLSRTSNIPVEEHISNDGHSTAVKKTGFPEKKTWDSPELW